MGCATSMSATRSNKHPNTIIIAGTKNNISLKGYLERDEKQQFGKSIVMGLIRDKRPRHNSDANLIHVGYIKSNSIYGRPRPTEDDFKFIEQRLTPHEIESQHTESTILTDTDSSEKGSVVVRKNRTIFIPPARQSTSHSSSTPHWGTGDYQKRFKDIKDVKTLKSAEKPRSEIESAQPRTRKKKIVETPRMEIVNHISREEYLNEASTSSNGVKPTALPPTCPPISIVHTQAKNKQISSLQNNQDDISESSCVVAWEQDYQHRSPHRLNPNWRTDDTDSEAEDSYTQQQRTKNVMELDEIKALDD
uniref:Uncharacterized protein n=1 Tax=Panagrolaimus davidi TaxID=227884 RepID=A0A914P5I2_9BILA